ncbi:MULTISPECIES: Lar family restriction alleviation protein [Serratia]|uniref:Lar family restriction alleviation protein n=2 Tax=Serratia TaxID=613 RepID=UPI0009318A55
MKERPVMPANELKPCPFCGGNARVVDSSYSGSAIHVSCRCGAQMFGGRQHFGSESEATDAWNRRAGDSAREVERG